MAYLLDVVNFFEEEREINVVHSSSSHIHKVTKEIHNKTFDLSTEPGANEYLLVSVEHAHGPVPKTFVTLPHEANVHIETEGKAEIVLCHSKNGRFALLVPENTPRWQLKIRLPEKNQGMGDIGPDNVTLGADDPGINI